MDDPVTAHELAVGVSINVEHLYWGDKDAEWQFILIQQTLDEIAERTK